MEENNNIENIEIVKQETEQPKWGYHSYRLNKDFGTLKELQSAEEAYEREHAAKEEKMAERKADAQKVEEALKHFYEVRRNAYQGDKV